MKRKITAILAADAVGYSRLVAEDEEDTLSRLASYRAVFSDFVTRFGGRIFNTAGDAILAEFGSAVDAVRCAVDIQESLRARNLAYTPGRQMSFRIGITIGDVVERDGDLLGDGVNVAARLESVAPDGGICISRSVYEVVANKVSLEFSDRGEQHLKNIPDPVHTYTFAPDVSSKNRKQASRLASLVTRHWTVIAVVIVVIAGIAGFMYGFRDSPDAYCVKKHGNGWYRGKIDSEGAFHCIPYKATADAMCARDGRYAGKIDSEGAFHCLPYKATADAWCVRNRGNGYYAGEITSLGGFLCFPSKATADANCVQLNSDGWYAGRIDSQGKFLCIPTKAVQIATCQRKYGPLWRPRNLKSNGNFTCYSSSHGTVRDRSR